MGEWWGKIVNLKTSVNERKVNSILVTRSSLKMDDSVAWDSIDKKNVAGFLPQL